MEEKIMPITQEESTRLAKIEREFVSQPIDPNWTEAELQEFIRKTDVMLCLQTERLLRLAETGNKIAAAAAAANIRFLAEDGEN